MLVAKAPAAVVNLRAEQSSGLDGSEKQDDGQFKRTEEIYDSVLPACLRREFAPIVQPIL
jgi:hypothetical protein